MSFSTTQYHAISILIIDKWIILDKESTSLPVRGIPNNLFVYSTSNEFFLRKSFP